jgi:tetratricopeptide (TPR) repeat protein
MTTRFLRSLALAICSLALYSCGSSSETGAGAPVGQENVSQSIAQNEKPSLFLKLKEYNHLPVKEIIAHYYRLKTESPNKYNFENEQELNRYGYYLLGEDKVKPAIEIFKLLISEFPNSANSYDSLGEAYVKDGNKKLAILNYEKSIHLEPRNNHAIDQVTILKGLEILVTDWGKEFFHFPLHFAQTIPYQGVEEVVFPRNWINPDSSEFWSYVFVWALDNTEAVTAKDLEDNLKLYFDGLIGGLSRVDTLKLTQARTQFKRNTDPNDSVAFTGDLNIFDGFATQEPLHLNARIYSNYCQEKDQLILLFRFSPQEFNHPVWDTLRTVEVRSSVCWE